VFRLLGTGTTEIQKTAAAETTLGLAREQLVTAGAGPERVST